VTGEVDWWRGLAMFSEVQSETDRDAAPSSSPCLSFFWMEPLSFSFFWMEPLSFSCTAHSFSDEHKCILFGLCYVRERFSEKKEESILRAQITGQAQENHRFVLPGAQQPNMFNS
jgi:hypothetical protein